MRVVPSLYERDAQQDTCGRQGALHRWTATLKTQTPSSHTTTRGILDENRALKDLSLSISQ